VQKEIHSIAEVEKVKGAKNRLQKIANKREKVHMKRRKFKGAQFLEQTELCRLIT